MVEQVEYDEVRSITLDEARKLLRSRLGTPRIAIVRQWASVGCRPRGKDGPVITLRAVWVCGRKRTMPEWVADFAKARAEAVGQKPPERRKSARRRSSRSREAAQKRAERKLDEMGVG